MGLVKLERLEKSFSEQIVFQNINIIINEGEFITIVGKSGCGKTTLLEILCDLQSPTSGKIEYSDKNINPIMVFQDYGKSIFPWLTVTKNIELVAKEKHPKENLEEVCNKYLQLVGLEKAKNKYPWQLSGGMQQRVAIARALAFEPKLLLLDEPFGSLDAGIKRELELELQRLWLELKITVVLVTHDVDEAVFLSNRILVLDGDPSIIKEEIYINLNFPRDYYNTLTSTEFIKSRKKVMKYFKNEK